MTQFLRVMAEDCQLVIDCDYVQEVAIWNEKKPPDKEQVWHDAVLEGASLPEMLGLPEGRITAAVVLRDPRSGNPAMVLGVSEIVGLINISESDFRRVLDQQSASSCLRSAAFSQELEKVLIRLEPEALIRSAG